MVYMLDWLDCAFAGSQVDEQTLVNGFQGLGKYGSGDKLKISRVLESGGGANLRQWSGLGSKHWRPMRSRAALHIVHN